MRELTNKEVQKRIHQSLDPLMKSHGFRRSARTYYRQTGDLTFVLHTYGQTKYYADVTGWPTHAFAVTEGVWVEGVSPGIYNGYPGKRDKAGNFIPDVFAAFHISEANGQLQDSLIPRMGDAPNRLAAERYGVTNPAEIASRSLWIMTESEDQQTALLEELKQQVSAYFLLQYEAYTSMEKLEHLVLDYLRQFNKQRGYDDDTPLSKDDIGGNFLNYLNCAVLFHQRYGPEEQYAFYLRRLEEWSRIHKKDIPPCYYCGVGNAFKL